MGRFYLAVVHVTLIFDLETCLTTPIYGKYPGGDPTIGVTTNYGTTTPEKIRRKLALTSTVGCHENGVSRGSLDLHRQDS